jgi:hypothetical protein
VAKPNYAFEKRQRELAKKKKKEEKEQEKAARRAQGQTGPADGAPDDGAAPADDAGDNATGQPPR